MVALHRRAKAYAGQTHPVTQRIVVTGSECTGKTTLARQLAQALHTPWVPEYAREYAESLGRVLTVADVAAIARGQMEREDAVRARSPHALAVVYDTDLVSTTVYADHYYGQCPEWILKEARERLGHLYLLSAIDIPWRADSVRDQPLEREDIQARFVDRLRDFGACVLPVAGHGDTRLHVALAAVRGWRASATP